MTVEPMPTPSAPAVAGPYSPAVSAGDWLVLAGQLGLDPATGTMRDGVEAQARQVMTNVAAVLADCGASLTDVAKTTVFVVDLADFATVNAAYADAFGAHRPARTTVQVAALPMSGLVEVEVWAFRPSVR